MRSDRCIHGLGVLLLCGAALCLANAQVTVERQPSGVVVHNGSETMHITVCGPDLIHVVAGPGDPAGASPATPWIANPCKPDSFAFQSDDKAATEVVRETPAPAGP